MVAFAGIDLMRHGVKPRKNLFQPPSFTYNFLAQSKMFLNLRWPFSSSSDCMLDLMTSVGYVRNQYRKPATPAENRTAQAGTFLPGGVRLFFVSS